MQWFAQAPSNIALIKYMGKKDIENNIPINPSLSYTLNNLLTSVMLENHSGKKDFWEPLDTPGALPFILSNDAQQRFLAHLNRLKKLVNYSGGFIVRSSNNFPHSSGLASSASSFAALTKCAILALCELTQTPTPSIEDQAQLSRAGSGSSCRSFFSPWALWDDTTVTAPSLAYQELLHHVIVISHAEKKVSSSEAHERIRTGKLYATRSDRALQNLKTLLNAFESQDWHSAYQVCWREFQDLHLLFSSCASPFSYITDQTTAALRSLQELWQREGDGPIVTMDAGPNIHILYRKDQADMVERFKRDQLVGHYDVL